MMNKQLKQYQKYLEQEASNFKLTAEDLSNLTDLGMMIPYWFVQDLLKRNKMKVWWLGFIRRIEKITLREVFE